MEKHIINTDPLPVDPSNTSNIGQKVEQGVLTIKEGMTEQGNQWDDQEVRESTVDPTEEQIRNYIKHPSPEENATQ